MFSKLSLVHRMPLWCTLFPSTAIEKLKVYVIWLHRLQLFCCTNDWWHMLTGWLNGRRL